MARMALPIFGIPRMEPIRKESTLAAPLFPLGPFAMTIPSSLQPLTLIVLARPPRLFSTVKTIHFPYNIGRYCLGDPLGITSNSASPADIPATAITHWEGGPEKTLQIQNLEINSTNDDVTFVWTSVEGGQYTIQRTQDLTTNSWIPFAQTNGIDATTPITDPGRARTDDKHFYRVGLNSISPFDDTGFVYEEVGLSQNNVLLLILDDWGIDSSELYNTTNGAALADMPNLRRLLFSDLNALPTSTPDKGLLFTRGYAQPVCAPTRATLLTGRQPYQHSVVNPTSGGTLPF